MLRKAKRAFKKSLEQLKVEEALEKEFMSLLSDNIECKYTSGGRVKNNDLVFQYRPRTYF